MVLSLPSTNLRGRGLNEKNQGLSLPPASSFEAPKSHKDTQWGTLQEDLILPTTGVDTAQDGGLSNIGA